MQRTVNLWFARSWVVIAAALSTACGDNAPVSPTGATANMRRATVSNINEAGPLPDLTVCPDLAASPGSTLLLRTFGIGFQIYHWDGASWGVATPSATIYADSGGQGEVAQHFGGPTWQSNSGSKVVGTVVGRCTPDTESIPWVSLSAIASGAGVFADVTFIQRLHTVGGKAPSTPGSFIGQEAKIPYTANYLFYKP